jgi:hypothetical protein
MFNKKLKNRIEVLENLNTVITYESKTAPSDAVPLREVVKAICDFLGAYPYKKSACTCELKKRPVTRKHERGRFEA